MGAMRPPCHPPTAFLRRPRLRVIPPHGLNQNDGEKEGDEKRQGNEDHERNGRSKTYEYADGFLPSIAIKIDLNRNQGRQRSIIPATFIGPTPQ